MSAAVKRNRKKKRGPKSIPSSIVKRTCQLCAIDFTNKSNLQQHIKETPGHSSTQCQCDGCNGSVYDWYSRKPEKSRVFRANRPPPTTIHCEPCSVSLLLCTVGKQCHMDERIHLRYALQKGLYCDDSAETFLTGEECRQHAEAFHVPTTLYQCIECNRDFNTECGLDAHVKNDRIHSRKLVGHICEPCNKSFSTDALLQSHLTSKQHKPIKCIGSSLCKRMFKLPAHMIAHMESGACISGWNRQSIASKLAQHDNANVIVKPGILGSEQPSLGNNFRKPNEILSNEPATYEAVLDDDSDDDRTVILTPTMSSTVSRHDSFSSASGSGTWTPASGTWTPASGAGYSEVELVVLDRICPICLKQFKFVHGLRAHLESTVHAPPIYHCPTFLFTADLQTTVRQRSFKSLEGLVGHLMAGKCEGGQETLGRAASFLEDLIGKMGLKTNMLSG